jgi:hypothetical protein
MLPNQREKIQKMVRKRDEEAEPPEGSSPEGETTLNGVVGTCEPEYGISS